MKDAEVWFAIPSASVDKCRATLPAWREMGYRIAVLQNRERGEIPADITVWSDSYPGWAGSINELCSRVVPRSAPIVVSGGDDMLPEPGLDAATLGAQFVERFPDLFGVMQPQGDAFLGARHYCGSPWLGRAWIERMYRGSGPMWPGYHHNWADNELFWVARGLGALWARADVAQRHEHFTRTGEDAPDYWREHVSARDRADVELYIARAGAHFPGHEPVGGAPVYDPGVFERENRGIAEAYWTTRYGAESGAGPCERRMRGALARCADEGVRRVALYGAGTHTRSVGGALMDPPVEVLCLIDDDRRAQGGRLWGFPIVSRDEALALRPDAVVLSSNTMEEELAERAGPFEAAGIRVVGLYAADGAAAGAG